MAPRTVAVAFAIVQGIVLWWLTASARAKSWPATDPATLAALLTPAVLVPPLAYLQLGLARLRSVAFVSLAAGLVLAALGWHYGAQVVGPAPPTDDPYGQGAFAFAIAVIVMCFHALPFLQSALVTRRLWPAYPKLFEFAWRNALQIALAVLFCAVLWALLALWMRLFSMIGIDFFRELFTDPRVAFPLTTVAFATAIALSGSVERLQQALRQQLLSLFKWLAVLAMLILTLFGIALLLRSPELFGAGRRVISAAWLLWLLVFCVYLLNAAYQDGSQASPYPRAVGVAVRLATPLLVVVAALALYALGVRIGSYGLTVPRAWALLVAALALVYAVGYTIAAWRRGAWMASMGTVNVVAALLLIATLMLMLTPALSPYRLAADSQVARILSGEDSAGTTARPHTPYPTYFADAYLTLAFDTGGYGRRQLAGLAELQGHPDAAGIRARATEVLASNERYGVAQAGPAAGSLTLLAFPEGRQIDATLRAAIAGAQALRWLAPTCRSEQSACPVLFADLDGDGVEEVVVFTDGQAFMLARHEGDWREVTLLGGGMDRASVLASLRAGDYRLVGPRWQRLEVGDTTLAVMPD
jgi:hypothetical protein